MKIVVLENIRSAYNVGAIFRTADATKVDKIYLVGYTPSPTDRFGRVQSEIKKTSLGASETVAWEHYEKIEEVIELLQQDSIEIIAIEITNHAQSLFDYQPSDRVAYVLGNEVEGVSEVALTRADAILKLPMCGEKESLNVSVTAGVVLYYDVFKQ